MRTKLRRIHALDCGNTIAELTGMRYKQRVFEYIGAFPQVAEKEIRTGILGAFVIAQSPLPFVAA